MEIPIPDCSFLDSLQLVQSHDKPNLLVYLVSEKEQVVNVPSALPSVIQSLAIKKKFKGDTTTVSAITISETETLALCGLGKKSEMNFVVKAAESLSKLVKDEKPESLTLMFDASEQLTSDQLHTFLQTLFFRMVTSECYKSKKADTPLIKLKSLSMVNSGSDDSLPRILERAKSVARGMIFCGALVDAPPNYCNSETFAKTVEKKATTCPNLSYRVLDDEACRKLKMGSFLAVASGSKTGARLVHLKYAEGTPKFKAAFLGKGITMDNGGYSLKPSGSLITMKCDMAGAATMISTAFVMSELQPKDVELHFLGVLTDNAIDKDAYVVGDIVTASNGKTIEILNTDAEGRLALCDGLVYAESLLGGPGQGVIVDAATLTGAAVVALGNEIAAVFSNSTKFVDEIITASRSVGEPLWHMPLHHPYLSAIQGGNADLKNCDMKATYGGGGSIMAGLFLEEFVSKKTEWGHLDIAGPAFVGDKGTSFGLQTLVKYIMSKSA